jgi:uncharacterized membrane protein YesL
MRNKALKIYGIITMFFSSCCILLAINTMFSASTDDKLIASIIALVALVLGIVGIVGSLFLLKCAKHSDKKTRLKLHIGRLISYFAYLYL